MPTTRDWHRNREMWIRVLERQTSAGLEVWNGRIRTRSFADARALRAWLSTQGVTGYAHSHLVMERFGYPDFVTATAEELIDAQYAGRPHLQPIYGAIIDAAARVWGTRDSGAQDVRLATLASSDVRSRPADVEERRHPGPSPG